MFCRMVNFISIFCPELQKLLFYEDATTMLLNMNGNGETYSSATSFNMKNCSAEQKLHDKKGSRAKKSHCKKSQQICDEKCFMCEWDH